jgi:GMP synthase (glutamine-hydrolysing)
MHIHFIIHEHFEAPGAYEIWGKHHGHTLTCSRVYQRNHYRKSWTTSICLS